jgi:hypothetical protein
VKWSDFSESLQCDIKSFFGDLRSGLAEARDVLFAAGDPDEIELACEHLELGWQDEQAQYFHLPASTSSGCLVVLRVYVHCACRLYGDPQEADVLKLHTMLRKANVAALWRFPAFSAIALENQGKLEEPVRAGIWVFIKGPGSTASHVSLK